tara:strand:+ start:1199 stop:1513 length:315 start_codon:yes stop_codon:yes gene_type:complete
MPGVIDSHPAHTTTGDTMNDIRRNDRRTYAVAEQAYDTYSSDPVLAVLRRTVWNILRNSARGEFTAVKSAELLEGLTDAESGWVWREVIEATRDAADRRENFGK